MSKVVIFQGSTTYNLLESVDRRKRLIMIREVISEDGKRRIKHIFKTDNVDEIKEHINNVLIEYIVQKVKENM